MRQFDRRDYDHFDLIVAMDGDNKSDLLSFSSLAPAHRAKVKLLREFDPQADGLLDVPDPYYGGPDGFENVYQMIERAARRLLDSIPKK